MTAEEYLKKILAEVRNKIACGDYKPPSNPNWRSEDAQFPVSKWPGATESALRQTTTKIVGERI